jgi:hypothetical protein
VQLASDELVHSLDWALVEATWNNPINFMRRAVLGNENGLYVMRFGIEAVVSP